MAKKEEEAAEVAQLQQETQALQQEIMELNQQQAKLQAEIKQIKTATNELAERIVTRLSSSLPFFSLKAQLFSPFFSL